MEAAGDVDAQYRVVSVNRDLYRIYIGAHLIGHARRGLDDEWYPELRAQRTGPAAIHSVIIAHQAIEQFLEAVHGHG